MRSSSLSAQLRLILDRQSKGTLVLKDIVSEIGEKGYGVFLVLLSLPSALPIPAPGYSTPFGILLGIIGFQMLWGKTVPWLPLWALEKKIKKGFSRKMMAAAMWVFARLEYLVKPRLAWIGGRWGLPLMGLLVLFMAFLMILPIPLTNTAPAMVIFLIGVGLLEKDGLFAGAACLFGVLSVALYSYAAYILLTVGREGVDHLLEYLNGF